MILDILALVSRASGGDQSSTDQSSGDQSSTDQSSGDKSGEERDRSTLGIVMDGAVMLQLQTGLVPLLCTFLQFQGDAEAPSRRVYGPFAGLSDERQKQVISLFYYTPSVSQASVKALTAVCGRRGKMSSSAMASIGMCSLNSTFL